MPVPELLTGTVTRLATTLPATKLTLEAVGWPLRVGYAVTYPGPCGATAVTLSTAASTPVAGTPPLPVTLIVSGWVGVTSWSELPAPVFVLHWVVPPLRSRGIAPPVLSQMQAGAATVEEAGTALAGGGDVSLEIHDGIRMTGEVQGYGSVYLPTAATSTRFGTVRPVV